MKPERILVIDSSSHSPSPKIQRPFMFKMALVGMGVLIAVWAFALPFSIPVAFTAIDQCAETCHAAPLLKTLAAVEVGRVACVTVLGIGFVGLVLVRNWGRRMAIAGGAAFGFLALVEVVAVGGNFHVMGLSLLTLWPIVAATSSSVWNR